VLVRVYAELPKHGACLFVCLFVMKVYFAEPCVSGRCQVFRGRKNRALGITDLITVCVCVRACARACRNICRSRSNLVGVNFNASVKVLIYRDRDLANVDF
jgi:hypothetical protein